MNYKAIAEDWGTRALQSIHRGDARRAEYQAKIAFRFARRLFRDD